MTIIEKILAAHSGKKSVKPGEIVDVLIDVRLARDFGGAGVVQNLQSNQLKIADPDKTFFTFDCNPTGSDQLYAANQQKCRMFARQNGIRVYDINMGIGTHLAIDDGLAEPGCTLVSTDSHANILGAIGAFGQGMGDRDIAAAWSRGSVWFKVPETIKVILQGYKPELVSAKDIALNMLRHFGADGLLGYAVEIYGMDTENLTLDERITISSMATEMGAIALLFPPSNAVIEYCKSRSYETINPVYSDNSARYANSITLDLSAFRPAVSLPGQPHNVVFVDEVRNTKIDSVFIGSCTNGRMEDMQTAAAILKGRHVAPGVVLKIVPATDEIWNSCLQQGLIAIFKAAGALVGSAGCAGCASGQIGQNGPGERTISTGNRNFEGKQGKGDVYLSSVATAAASAVAGFITTADKIPEHPVGYNTPVTKHENISKTESVKQERNIKPFILKGRVWIIERDNIDTDMIYHNRHLAVTRTEEMGQYAFGNLKGFEHFAAHAREGDIIITGNNFGSGSSRQHAVDCFRALGVQAILARSFGSIYERNAINAGFPVFTYTSIEKIQVRDGDEIEIDMQKSILKNLRNDKTVKISEFSSIQKEIYEKGDLLLI
ncbi:MAG TPA: aconitase/3-isopropylmalate dehydratase large subunit family protein [Bacteroidales bacterium]|nr:aconitase/3-isopropylmalate dehydratase large subunit family protein [Bacteroidales bacterium]